MDDDPIPALKRQVAETLKREIARHYDTTAAQLMGIDRPRVSDIRRGRLQRLSLESLIRFAVRLRVNVELQLTRHTADSRKSGGASVGPTE